MHPPSEMHSRDKAYSFPGCEIWEKFCQNPKLKKMKKQICAKHFDLKYFIDESRSKPLLRPTNPISTLDPPTTTLIALCIHEHVALHEMLSVTTAPKKDTMPRIGEKMTPEINLSPNKYIGEGHPCLVVAEIGQNHQGDINVAEELISTSKDCGADVVKFQMSCLTEKFTKSALAREYKSCNSWGKTYGEHKQYLEFTKEQYQRLQNFAKDKDVLFTASAMDVASLDFLNSLNPPFIKIGSGDNTNYFLLEKALALNKPLVISTGMLDMKGVRSLYSKCAYKCQGVLLHCVSSYPAPPSDINLNVLDTYKEEFPLLHYGYSGHEKGIAISLAAVTKGAKVIERHITLNKTWKGTDHSCSLEPSEFSDMVKGIREIEECLGSKEKQFLKCESPCFEKLGKSIVAGTNILCGTELTLQHLKIKVSEPRGMNPTELFNVVGKTVIKNIEEDGPITKNCFSQV